MTTTQHTPGPWRRDPDLPDIIDNSHNPRTFAKFMSTRDRDRAVSCVNACEGINPEAVLEMLKACLSARLFIKNGIELGYINLPEKDDPACYTLPKLESTIALAEGTKAPKPYGDPDLLHPDDVS